MILFILTNDRRLSIINNYLNVKKLRDIQTNIKPSFRQQNHKFGPQPNKVSLARLFKFSLSDYTAVGSNYESQMDPTATFQPFPNFL